MTTRGPDGAAKATTFDSESSGTYTDSSDYGSDSDSDTVCDCGRDGADGKHRCHGCKQYACGHCKNGWRGVLKVNHKYWCVSCYNNHTCYYCSKFGTIKDKYGDWICKKHVGSDSDSDDY